MDNVSSSQKNNDILKLGVAFILYQLILHIYVLISAQDPRLVPPTLIAILHDVILLVCVMAFFELLVYFSSDKLKPLVSKISSFSVIIISVLLAFYPTLLREYILFPVNILESDISSAQMLFTEYLGITAFIPSFIAIVIGLLLYASSIRVSVSNRVKIGVVVGSLIILVLTLKEPSSQPFLYSLQMTIENITSGKQRVVPSLQRSSIEEPSSNTLQKLKYSINNASSYSHVLLIVLEGVTASSFEGEFFTINKGFFERYSSNTAYFTNYYTGNLDSYTSLISMLTAIQVPYRAYAEVNLYENVNSAPSITADLQQRDFHTVFISCYEHQPFVPTRKFWHEIYDKTNINDADKWLTLGSSKMEKAVEDKAAISLIIDKLKSKERNFILHELVYGHSPEWMATTGKSQNQYYNEYLLDLSHELQSSNLWDKTLLVVVSDHGERSKYAELENYRIPLLFIGKYIEGANRIDSLFTHTEFAQLMYHYIYNDSLPTARNEMYFVGSTGKWVYGKALKNKDNVFIDDARGIKLFSKGNIKAGNVYTEFQDYLHTFNREYGIMKKK